MKNTAQVKNSRSGKYIKVDLDKGIIVSHKKSDRPYKNIKILRKKNVWVNTN